MPFDFRVIDADNHYYEQDDCFSRHMERKFQDEAFRLVPGERPDTRRWVMGNRPFTFMDQNPADAVPLPGALAGLFAGKASFEDRESMEVVSAFDHDDMMHRSARLATMDAQGAEAVIMLPTVAVLAEHDYLDSPPALCANYRSFNRWLEEEWGFGDDGRIFGVPVLTLLDMEWAISELERVAKAGAKVIWLKTGPVAGHSPADPVFDPFWARVEELEIRPTFHIGDGGFSRMYGPLWGEQVGLPVYSWSPLLQLLANGERPISDTMGAVILHNLFGRFPGIKMLSIENGSAWIAPLFRGMDKAAKAGHGAHWLGGKFDDKPSDVFRQHVYVAPYHEDDIPGLMDLLGPDHVLFGSDWPHPEGVGPPESFLEYASGLDQIQLRMMMRENTGRLLGLTA